MLQWAPDQMEACGDGEAETDWTSADRTSAQLHMALIGAVEDEGCDHLVGRRMLRPGGLEEAHADVWSSGRQRAQEHAEERAEPSAVQGAVDARWHGVLRTAFPSIHRSDRDGRPEKRAPG